MLKGMTVETWLAYLAGAAFLAGAVMGVFWLWFPASLMCLIAPPIVAFFRD